MYITDNKGNINNERNMRQRRSLHVCRYVRTLSLSHTHTHTHAVHEEDQAQELAVDAARGRHERRQESHVPVAAICVTIIADLVGSGALEDVARVVGVAELAFMLPYLTIADEIVAQVDVHQQIGLLATRILRISRSARRLPSLVSTRLWVVAKPVSLQMRSNARKAWLCTLQLQA